MIDTSHLCCSCTCIQICYPYCFYKAWHTSVSSILHSVPISLSVFLVSVPMLHHTFPYKNTVLGYFLLAKRSCCRTSWLIDFMKMLTSSQSRRPGWAEGWGWDTDHSCIPKCLRFFTLKSVLCGHWSKNNMMSLTRKENSMSCASVSFLGIVNVLDPFKPKNKY